MLKVLIVEDQPAVVTALQVLFEIRGMACAVARSPEEALRRLDADGARPEPEIGVVLQDMNFSPEATSGEEGIALFREVKKRDPGLPVLLITAWTSLETAVQLVKEGASDYLAKPWDDEKLLASVRNLLRLRELQLENARLRGRARRSWEDLAERHDLCGAVWASEKMHAVVTLALQVARGDDPGADHRPLRRRQGEAGRDRPGQLAAQGAPVRPRQRRRAPRRAAGERALRRRGRRLHRRHPPADRPLRGGGRRHPLPRRDRQPLRLRAGEAPARAPERPSSSAWGAARPGGWTCG